MRFEEQIDQSSTVKFVYIHWAGKQVPFTMKGRYGIVHGSVKKIFEVRLIKCIHATIKFIENILMMQDFLVHLALSCLCSG